jgi:two-component system, NtrC family, sensor kinase
LYRLAANYGFSPQAEQYMAEHPMRLDRGSVTGRVALEGRAIHIPDVLVDPEYRATGHQAAAGYRTILGVPLLREGTTIGVFTLTRDVVNPFTEKQIGLVTTFADQALIAIENARLLNELRESLQQQTATADVLKVISRSTFDLHTVLDALVVSAARLCEAEMAGIAHQSGEKYLRAASYGHSPEFNQFMARIPIPSGRGSIAGRVLLEGRAVQVEDVQTDPEKEFKEAAKVGGMRTMLGVPLLREGSPIGVIVLSRRSVRPFSNKQIGLVTTFADQAVIAIENTRLFEAEQQRTRELAESLEQQTATSEVLQVISSSPSDLQPVFEAMLENAVRICDANFGNIYRWDGEALHLVATHNTPAAFAEFRKHSPLRTQESAVGRMVATKTVVHIADNAASQDYEQRKPAAVATVELGGVRTVLAVPMLKESELIGSFSVYRQEVRPFTDKQIALVTNFAAQAVIAIENARLLNELRQRTADLSQRTVDLTESLEQQTATTEVLQVISSSPGDLQPVFETMLEKAVRICDAKFGNIYRWDGDALHLLATHNTPLAYAEARRRSPVRPVSGEPLGRLVASKRAVHIDDLAVEPSYIEHRHPAVVAAVELGGVRTCQAVPMLKEHELVGSISLFRQEVLPFTDKQIALVTNFASQAVIAIENARLLKELRERTGELEVQSWEVVKLNQQLEQRVADQVGEIERMGRLRRFLPPQVADLIVASGTEKQLESHRREIAALFCDLRGFTGFTESADAEDVMALLREYHAAIGEIISGIAARSNDMQATG